MATGKSRIAQLTAAALGWSHFDTDVYVEQKAGMTVSQIFEEKGEGYFRELELESLLEISAKENIVISLGGGTLNIPQARQIISRDSTIVSLWAQPEIILNRVNRKDTRPLLANLSSEEKFTTIQTMLKEREELYASADFRVESREDVPHHVLTKKIIQRIQLETLSYLTVDLGSRSYPIYIEEDLSRHCGIIAEKYGTDHQFIIATDSNIKTHHPDLIQQISNSLGKCKVFFFRPGEEEKNLRSISKFHTFLLKHNFSRKTTVLAIGGGVVGDMTGFAASIYLRGVNFIQIPTTLLAMVDSSVGGKTGVNHRLGKNLIGTFYQPQAVIININTLSTLPPQEYLAGLGEVIKYAIIWDKQFFDLLMHNHEAVLSRSPDLLKQIITRCCTIKAEIVSKDEQENGLRAILNYGHTFGHAIETLAGYGAITHGLAVTLGMRVAARLAVSQNILSPSQEQEHNQLLDLYNMPKVFKIDPQDAWRVMGVDKKVAGTTRHYILPVAIGQAKKLSNFSKESVIEAWSAISSSSE